MINKLPSLLQLTKQLQSVPYLASKNLYKVAFHFLTLDEKKLEQFCAVLTHAHENIELCSVCCALKEKKDACLFCAASKRDRSIICVVETWQELLSIEKTGGYFGLYHVLGGAISPLDGIGPEDLGLDLLASRLKHNQSTELIIATNPTVEGEATAHYIAELVKKRGIKTSRIAHGVPLGSELEFVDGGTLSRALLARETL